MSTLADRLFKASGRLFVGREEQCALFANALKAPELPFSIIHVYGPGGIGKTSLLYEFRRICQQSAISAYYLDARTTRADALSFSDAVQQVSGGEFGNPHTEASAGQGKRSVLFIDTFEVLGSLEQWLYNTFFASLSDQVLIVLAGRQGPSTVWTSDPGWQSVIKKMPLRNLSPGEIKTYLTKTGVPEEHHDPVVEYTHGHPLALSLLSDLYSQRPSLFLETDLGPNLIKVLLDRFVKDVPSQLHRRALEACALVNHLTEPLLKAMVEEDEVSNLFEWLRTLSFIEAGPRGVFPHDLARDVLGADLKWRNPEQYKVLHQHARSYYNTHLQDAGPSEQRNILSDYIYLHRDNPVVRPFFKRLKSTWSGDSEKGYITTHRYEPADEPAILQMVEEHESASSAETARKWLQLQPENVLVYKDAGENVQGFLMSVALHDLEKNIRKEDAVAHEAWTYINEHSPLRPGERVTLFRFWMDRTSYQKVSRVQSMIFVSMVRHYLTTPNLAFSFLPISKPLFWKLIFNYADLHRIRSLNFKVKNKTYGMYGHDWRSRPPAAWLDLLASREVWGGKEQEEKEPLRPVIVLSEEMFTTAVRDALKSYTKPLQWKNNPLLDSRIVSEKVDAKADVDDRIAVMMEILRESLRRLEQDPRREKIYKAIERTYIRPAGSQEHVSELLGMPYSTFRRHLSNGVSEIVSELWQREIGLY